MLPIAYCSGALLSFCLWFTAFQGDSSTPKTDVLSWVVLLTAVLLWPISLPVSLQQRVDDRGDCWAEVKVRP
jgi:hypothetical protein